MCSEETCVRYCCAQDHGWGTAKGARLALLSCSCLALS
jgi:hypothetical protein